MLCVHILPLRYYCVHRCVRACAVCVAEYWLARNSTSRASFFSFLHFFFIFPPVISYFWAEIMETIEAELSVCNRNSPCAFSFFLFLEGTARNHSITAHADSSCETYVAAPDYENEDRIKSWPSPRSLYGPANNLNRGRCSGEVETAIRFVYMCWGTISRTPASEKEPAAAAAAGKEGNEDEEETISRADTAGLLLLPDWNGESLLIALRQKGGWDEERRRRGARVMNYCPTIYLQPGGCDWINNQRAVCIFHATISAGPSISSLCNQSGDMLGNGERREEGSWRSTSYIKWWIIARMTGDVSSSRILFLCFVPARFFYNSFDVKGSLSHPRAAAAVGLHVFLYWKMKWILCCCAPPPSE